MKTNFCALSFIHGYFSVIQVASVKAENHMSKYKITCLDSLSKQEIKFETNLVKHGLVKHYDLRHVIVLAILKRCEELIKGTARR